jgi:nucleoside-diphosphate-sugar epimerase
MKRVLVTGGTGFIGRETLPFLLEHGFEVHLVTQAASNKRDETSDAGRAVYHQCDLVNENCESLLAKVRPTHLLHFAWYAKHGAFWWAPENLDWIAASLRLTRAFSASGGVRAVFAGSCAEYDWAFHTLDEVHTPLRPRTLYGVGKSSLYLTLNSAAKGLGISIGWGRIFFPYGPHDQPGKLISTVIDKLSRGESVACSEGSQARAFIYVEDAARAFVELLDSDVIGAVNIATDRVYTVRDVVARVARLCADEKLVQFGAATLQTGEPPFMAASVRRLFDEVGFSPRFDLDQGLKRTVGMRLRHTNSLKT